MWMKGAHEILPSNSEEYFGTKLNFFTSRLFLWDVKMYLIIDWLSVCINIIIIIIM